MNFGVGPLRPCLITFGITCFLLPGSGNAADGNPHLNGRTQVVRLDREFNLKARHQVTLKGATLRIKFAEVKEDSRCPSNVKCVWAGNAARRLELAAQRGNPGLCAVTALRYHSRV